MTQLTRSTKVALMVGAALVLLIPLVIVTLRYPPISRYFTSLFGLQKKVVSTRYSAVSQYPNYSLRLVDTAYFELVAAKLRLFDTNGILIEKITNGVKRAEYLTITAIEFRLVDHVNVPMTTIVPNAKPFEQVSILGQAEFIIEDDTLVIAVYINMDEVAKQNILLRNDTERKYLTLATRMLYAASAYARQNYDNRTSSESQISRDLQLNLDGGVFAWPVLIEKQ